MNISLLSKRREISLKVGLIGCGGIAPAHLMAYQKFKDVEVVGLCDLDVEKAKNLTRKFRIKKAKAFDDYLDLCEIKDLELVDICTPVSTHARIVCDVAKHVPAILVEKPMALNISECDLMINAVEKHKAKLCIGHSQIFSPNIVKAKALIDSGEFNLFSFNTIQKESFELLNKRGLAAEWNVNPRQRGIIWEVCTHLVYLQLHFLPDIKEVYAVGGKVKYPVYDDFAILLRTKDERFGLIELSWVSKETDIIYELSDFSGKRLQIYRDFDYFLVKDESPPFSVGSVLRNIFVDGKRVLYKWTRFGISYLQKRKILPLTNLILSYIETIKKDLPPPVSPNDGRNTVRLLECIEKSLKLRKPINFSH